MIRRFAIAACVPAAALLAVLTTAGPASAGAGANCSGSTCSVDLSQYVTVRGDQGSGSAQVPVHVDPPPCLWNPIGDATSGSNAIISEWAPNPPTTFQIDQSYAKAKDLVKNPAPGTWYELPVNPGATAAGKAACLKMPLYAWVPLGQSPPPPPIPPRTLAAYAFNHLTLPRPVLETNPAGRGYVNLGTYVWARWTASPTTGRTDAYKITATAGNQTVTLWAQASKLRIDASANGTPSTGGCGPAGSGYPAGKPPATAGPGTRPDCGVLWHAPAAGSTVSAAVTWTVTWGLGNLNGPGPNVVPGGASITVTGQTPPFPVEEIQSVNGG